MLPSTKRLKSHAEFKRVYGRGMSAAGRHMVVYGAPGQQGERRLGLSVSKKTGGAVSRNRIRRRLSEAFAREQRGLPESYDAVIVARAPISGISYQNMEIELAKLLSDLAIRESRAQRA